MLVEDMSSNTFFSSFECHMFYVLDPSVPYLLTLPRISSLLKGNFVSVLN
jgi:hypothetical protein